MAVPNLAPNYLGQMKQLREQRAENERQRAFQRQEASSNFLRTLGRDVLGTALNIGQDVAGTAFRDYLEAPERLSKQGISTYDDSDFGEQAQAIRKAAEARATAELRPESSFGEAAETGMGRRGIDLGPMTLGGAKAAPLQAKPAAPAPPPTTRPANPMMTPGLESQIQGVVSRPVAPASPRGIEPEIGRRPIEPMQMRGMESEAPRRPSPSTQAAPVAQARPMPGRETREAPGGYSAPRLSLPQRADVAAQEGVRAALPLMDPKARGLEQQAMDVREDRRLRLELLRRQAEAEAMTALAQVDKLRAEGASSQLIAQAKAEADRALSGLRYAQAAAAGKPLTDRRGRTIYQPAQVATPYGSTAEGFGAVFGPPPERPAAPTGGGGGKRPGEMEGDAITIVRQLRDRKGDPRGPSQPLRIPIGPALFREAATSPIDLGFEKTEDVAAFRDAYREYNAAMSGARKGDPMEVARLATAQNRMVGLLQQAQAKYAPAVAATKEGFGTSPKDLATEQLRQDVASIRNQLSMEDRASGRTRRVGNIIQEVATLADPAQVTVDEVSDAVLDAGVALPADRGRFVTSDGMELERDQYEAAVRGLPVPSTLDATLRPAYEKVAAAARQARERKTAEKEGLRARRLEGIALQMQAEGEADPIGAMERAGVVVPAQLKSKPRAQVPTAPAPTPRAPAPVQSAPSEIEREPRFNSAQEASDWVRKKPWPADVKRSTLMAILREQGLTPPAGQ